MITVVGDNVPELWMLVTVTDISALNGSHLLLLGSLPMAPTMEV
jgi:hypothetical protein